MWSLCCRCKEHKPLWRFDRCKRTSLGIQSICKECRRKAEKGLRRPGRPTGFKCAYNTKSSISFGKTGDQHTETTKKKISDGVKGEHETGAPIKVLMKTDLSKCGKVYDGRYVNVVIPNPIVGEPSFKMRFHTAVMEQSLGRKLLPGEEIHHWFSKTMNDRRYISLAKDRIEHKRLDKIKMKVKNNLYKMWNKEI